MLAKNDYNNMTKDATKLDYYKTFVEGLLLIFKVTNFENFCIQGMTPVPITKDKTDSMQLPLVVFPQYEVQDLTDAWQKGNEAHELKDFDVFVMPDGTYPEKV